MVHDNFGATLPRHAFSVAQAHLLRGHEPGLGVVIFVLIEDRVLYFHLTHCHRSLRVLLGLKPYFVIGRPATECLGVHACKGVIYLGIISVDYRVERSPNPVCCRNWPHFDLCRLIFCKPRHFILILTA